MQKLILIILTSLFLLSCKRETKAQFSVSGKIVNGTTKKIYLEESPVGSQQAVIVDSNNVAQDGSFHLKTVSKEQSLYNLILDNNMAPVAAVINDVPSVKVNIDAQKKDFTVEGSKASADMKSFMDNTQSKWSELNQLGMQMNGLMQAKASDSLIEAINKKGLALLDDLKNSVQNFINTTNSPVAATFAFSKFPQLFSIDEYESVMNGIAKRFPQHKGVATAKEINDKRIVDYRKQQEARNTSWVGKDAPEINLPDVNGNKIALSSFRGKYVLVDFWASWCGPCRAENPNVVKAYNLFKNKNFTILGVSLDDSKSAWLNAINKDNLTWTHVSDLKRWESEVVPIYGFAETGIPFNVLVDPNGKIIAQALRGDALENKLTEVLK